MWKDTKIWLSAVEHHNRNIDVFTTVKRRHSLTPLDRLSILRIYMKKKIKAERHTSNPKSRMRHHHKLNEKREGATTRTLRSSTGKLLLSFQRQETPLHGPGKCRNFSKRKMKRNQTTKQGAGLPWLHKP